MSRDIFFVVQHVLLVLLLLSQFTSEHTLNFRRLTHGTDFPWLCSCCLLLLSFQTLCIWRNGWWHCFSLCNYVNLHSQDNTCVGVTVFRCARRRDICMNNGLVSRSLGFLDWNGHIGDACSVWVKKQLLNLALGCRSKCWGYACFTIDHKGRQWDSSR